MKAIVVRQPWATLIALKVKTIETRPSPPNGPMRPDGVRGLPGLPLERGERIAIVAGAAKPAEGLRLGRDAAWTTQEFVVSGGRLLELCNEEAWPLPLGAVVCTVTVDDALPIVGEDGDLNLDRSCIERRPSGTMNAGLWLWPNPEDLPEDINPPDITDQLPFGDFTPGRWGWMLSDPQPCDPIPCKGRQGVFRLPADVAEALR